MSQRKSVRRSFVLPADVMDKLITIQSKERLANPSEALVFALRHSYETLFTHKKPSELAELIPLVKKDLVILKHILVELAKLNGGKFSLTEESKAYLAELNEEVKKHLKGIGE